VISADGWGQPHLALREVDDVRRAVDEHSASARLA
jgi:hypothetical protein